VKFAGEVLEVLGQLTGSAVRVDGLLNEIAAMSDRQVRGVGDVTGAVSQLETVTQSNAAAAEESAHAARSLSGQAEQMTAVVRELITLVRDAGATGAPGTPSAMLHRMTGHTPSTANPAVFDAG
jgi:methyl-accepting chemotaxis protein